MEPQERAGHRLTTARLPALASLAALALFLLPARVTALRGDDVFSLQQDGRLELEGESLLGYVWEGAWDSLTEGRPQPLGSLWGNLVIAVFGDERVAYKLFLVAVTVGCAALLYALVRRLGGSRGVAAMVVVLLAGAVQFRQYHDPMLGYYGTTQAALACVLGSLLLELRFLRGGSRRDLVLAVALFVAAVLLYEIASPMAVVHVGLAVVERRWRAGLPFLGVAFAFVLYGFVLRTFGGADSGGGYAVNYDLGLIVGTYFEQLLPPIPGSNYLFGDGALFERPTAPELFAAAWRGAVVLGVVLWVGLRCRLEDVRLLPIAVMGALIVASPVLLIALAEKYQRELSAATGYLPVIVQSFGWALLAGAAVVAAARWRRVAVVPLALLLSAGAALSGYDVVRVAATEVPRAAVSDALHDAAARGALENVPAGATVLLVEADIGSGLTGWGHRQTIDSMMLDQTGRRYDARMTPSAGIGTCEADAGEPHPVDCGPVQPRAAWVRAGTHRDQTVVTVAAFEGPVVGTTASSVHVYVEGDTSAPQLTASLPDDRNTILAWERVDGGDDWAIYAATPPLPAADTISLPGRTIDLAAPTPPADLVRRIGTRRVLP